MGQAPDTAEGSTIGLEIGIGVGLAASDGIDVAVGNGVGGATERAGRSLSNTPCVAKWTMR